LHLLLQLVNRNFIQLKIANTIVRLWLSSYRAPPLGRRLAGNNSRGGGSYSGCRTFFNEISPVYHDVSVNVQSFS
jgi:hypothetical protein